MSRTTRRTFLVDELEGRALLATTTGTSVWSNPAVQADLAKIQADQTALQTEVKMLAPTLQADRQAIQTAIQNAIKNDTTVQTAETTLKNAESAAQTTLQNDLKAFFSATTSAERQAALKVFFSDLASTGKTIATDQQAVQTAINADSGVQAAQAKLTSDEAPITADQATLQADYAQLEKDIQAALTSTTTATSSAIRARG